MRKGIFVFLAFAVIGAGLPASAQNHNPQNEPIIKVYVDLVELRTLVKDGATSIRNLREENFRVYLDCKEKNAKRRLEKCRPVDGVKVDTQNLPPISAALLLDETASMGLQKIMTSAKRALLAISKISRQEDNFKLLTFTEKLTTVVDWTSDLEAINEGIRRIEARRGSNTLILDALYETILEMEKVEGKRTKWIILVSDLKIDPGMRGRRLVERASGMPCPREWQGWSGPNHGKCREVTYEDILDGLLRAQVGLYVIDYSKRSGRDSERFEAQTEKFAAVISQAAEGRLFQVKNEKEAASVFDELAKWLDVVYLINFYIKTSQRNYDIKVTVDAGLVNKNGEFEPKFNEESGNIFNQKRIIRTGR